MLFSSTKLPGVFLIDIDKKSDERGFFARTICEEELAKQGLVSRFVQTSVSFNKKAGTLRGMHWQAPPHEEVKIVRCTRGRVWDVAVDVKPQSKTFKQWVGVELSAENHRSIYIPAGCVAMPKDNVGDRVGDRVGVKATENQKKIISAMANDPGITALKLSKKLGISVRKTEQNIKNLKVKGLIARVGSDKSGYWEVVAK